MNDIEVLERFRNYNKFYKEEDGKLTITIDLDLKTELDKAIENLLKERQSDKERIKDLEENNQQLEKWLNYYKLGNTVEEFEKIFGNTPINDIEEIKKYIFQNYIPKSLIKEKIEELKEEIEQLRIEKNVTYDSGIYRNRIKLETLQELLEKRK